METMEERTCATTLSGKSWSPWTVAAWGATCARISSSELHTQRASHPGTTSPHAKDFTYFSVPRIASALKQLSRIYAPGPVWARHPDGMLQNCVAHSVSPEASARLDLMSLTAHRFVLCQLPYRFYAMGNWVPSASLKAVSHAGPYGTSPSRPRRIHGHLPDNS